MLSAETIGKKLRELRGIRTRRGAAKEMGIGESALNNYESGKRIPNDKAKEILARYYGLTVGELFYAEENNSEC